MFKDYANLEVINENKNFIHNIRTFVSLMDEYCESVQSNQRDNYENSVYMIMSSIRKYGKEAYNCMERGDFFALSMLTRAIIENYTIMLTISENKDKQLYKYWITWSFISTYEKQLKNNVSPETSDTLKSLIEENFKENGLPDKLLTDKDFKSDYGWTIGLGKKMSRYRLADTLDKQINSDYQKLNDFVHGASYLQKQFVFTFDITPLYIIFTAFDYLYKACTYYFKDELDDIYYILTDTIYRQFGDIIHNRNYNV